VKEAEVLLGTSADRLDQPAPVYRARKTTYSGLTAGTAYHYAVADTSLRGTFRTPPTARSSFEFIVYGDTRSRHDMHRRVMQALERQQPHFVIHTGDLVLDGSDTRLWPIFFSIEAALLRRTAFYPCLGNHERNHAQYYEFFDVKTPYYSFNWGTLHVSVLDSDVGNIAGGSLAQQRFWSEQTSWLERDLETNQKADLRIVACHHPPLSAVASRQKSTHPVQELMPLFERYKVHAVFGGHDHNYQHHVKNGVHYIVTGGGGAPLYPVDAPLEGVTQKVVSVEHYVLVKVEGDRAMIQAIDLEGKILDTVSLPSVTTASPDATDAVVQPR
jgi:3',5'-cyclic AMP phosphodiesterase CpdA